MTTEHEVGAHLDALKAALAVAAPHAAALDHLTDGGVGFDGHGWDCIAGDIKAWIESDPAETWRNIRRDLRLVNAQERDFERGSDAAQRREWEAE